MSQSSNKKQYDLEERTYTFARECRLFIKKLSKTIGNMQDTRQLVRSSGSVAANDIEANEALSKKDFAHRIKICKKEIKESRLWLRLVDTSGDESLDKDRVRLMGEATELMKIFGAIIEKSK